MPRPWAQRRPGLPSRSNGASPLGELGQNVVGDILVLVGPLVLNPQHDAFVVFVVHLRPESAEIGPLRQVIRVAPVQSTVGRPAGLGQNMAVCPLTYLGKCARHVPRKPLRRLSSGLLGTDLNQTESDQLPEPLFRLLPYGSLAWTGLGIGRLRPLGIHPPASGVSATSAPSDPTIGNWK